MNPDQEDPNNHVPKVSADDQWDDLDSDSNTLSPHLPPRRVDRSIPPKKEVKHSNVTRHGASLRFDKEPTVKSSSDAVEKSDTSKKQNNGKKAAKKKVAKKAAKKNRESSSGDRRDRSDVAEAAKKKTEGIVPAVPEGKASRMRVREITPEKESGAPVKGIAKTIPSVPIQDQKTGDEEVAKQRRRFVRGERNHWGEKKGRDSTSWMLYSGIGIVLLVVFAVFLAQRASRKTERESDKSFFSQLEASDVVDDETTNDEVIVDFLTDSQDEAKEIYAAFATAKTIDDFSEFLYLGEENMEIIRADWKPTGIRDDWHPGDQTAWTIQETEGGRYGILTGMNEDFTSFSAVFRNGDGGMKLDWKATVGYSSESFAELKTGKGDGREIRASVSLTDFYTYALPEEKYQAYRLMSPDGEYTLWGYTEIDGELGKKLRELFTRSEITGEAQHEVQVVIRINPGPEESLPNQWMIEELVRLSWLDN